MMQDAEAYKAQVVALAEGDVARFNSVYAAYAQAPEVTRQRMYIETIEQIMQQSKKVIVDTQQGGNGNMIYLPLDKLLERSARAPGHGAGARAPARRRAAHRHDRRPQPGSALMQPRFPRCRACWSWPASCWSGSPLFQVSETEAAIRTQFGEIVARELRARPAPEVAAVDRQRAPLRAAHRDAALSGRDLPHQREQGADRRLLREVARPRRRAVLPRHRRQRRCRLARLGDNVKDGIKGVVARRTLQEIVITERTAFTGDMFSRASDAVKELGLELIDVRVQRIDLPDEVSGSVYQRMQESFRARGNQLRAEGSAEAERIRAEADRKRTEILANAQRDAQRLRGEGDAAGRRASTAQAYGKSPEFYAFYRSLQAYRNSLAREGDVWVVTPEGEFFKYLNSPGRR